MTIRNLVLFNLLLACLTHPTLSLGQDSTSQPSDEILRDSKPADFNRSTYYKNKLEFSLETGWLPINVPFAFDFLLGDGYNFLLGWRPRENPRRSSPSSNRETYRFRASGLQFQELSQPRATGSYKA
jgi:hypothetical protein